MVNYFVVFENRYKSRPHVASNIILRGIHPVIWAAQQPESYKEVFECYLLFWQEIPDEVATNPDVARWVSVMEYKEGAPNV